MQTHAQNVDASARLITSCNNNIVDVCTECNNEYEDVELCQTTHMPSPLQ